MPFELLLVSGSFLIALCIFVSTISSRLGIPALLLFLAVGMLAGSEGPGGIHFDDPSLVQSFGVVALAYILFSGGLDTNWRTVRPVLPKGLLLSTLGVFLTALLVGGFVHLVLNFTLLEGLLLGAIVSSTDAAAVFSVLRSRKASLKGELRPLLELESGSNDPMAVFLTVGIIMLLQGQAGAWGGWALVPMLIWQLAAGAAIGYVLGKGGVNLVNRLRLEHDGLYPVLTLSFVPFVYGVTALLKGNSFLAVYVAALVMGNSAFIHKTSLIRFHDGVAWLMQIAMFLVLGLQVYPSHLLPIIGAGLLTAGFLMLVARPVSVFSTLLFSRMGCREKLMISWVGLRGAVPIVLATFPLLAGVEKAEIIFNIVFFIVLTSALLQGSSLPLVARWLGVDAPLPTRPRLPLAFEPDKGTSGELLEVEIAQESHAVNKQIVDLKLPKGALIVLLQRNGAFLVPSGGTVIEAGDILHFLSDKKTAPDLVEKLQGRRL